MTSNPSSTYFARELARIRRGLEKAKTKGGVNEAAADIEMILSQILDEGIFGPMPKELRDFTIEIRNQINDFYIPEKREPSEYRDFRTKLGNGVKILVAMLTGKSQARDISAMMQSEREFLSSLPKDVADKIAEAVSGKKGSIGAQLSQLRVEHNRPGVPDKSEGGRKTRKNRTSKKNTRGKK